MNFFEEVQKSIELEVKKTNNWNIKLFFMWISTVSIWEFAFRNGVVNAWILSKIMWKSALWSSRTVVFIIQLFAGLFRWFRSIDLSSESVRKMATESIFAIAHVIMDAWIKASVDMFLATVFFAFAFFNWKVLVGTKVLNHFKFTFKFFILEEFFVVHLCWLIWLINIKW